MDLLTAVIVALIAVTPPTIIAAITLRRTGTIKTNTDGLNTVLRTNAALSAEEVVQLRLLVAAQEADKEGPASEDVITARADVANASAATAAQRQAT